MREYYAYLLIYRVKFSTFLHAGKLTQQFIIDMFAKIEDHRLTYLRLEATQARLRIESYIGLHDFVHNRANTIGY